MSCYHPITGYRSTNGGITFKTIDAVPGVYLKVPCGKCIGCRLDYARDWAIRCWHEASLYERNCFVTLTFNDECLNKNLSLDKKIFVDFLKRLRSRFPDDKIRFFHCGEYGEETHRPHHHVCFFNFDFPDKVVWKVVGDTKLYLSATLCELWPFGFSTIGDVTFESAAYVARYVVKKAQNRAFCKYGSRVPEYTTMSRRPGIGSEWCKKYIGDVFPRDYVVLRGGFKFKPPRFYDERFSLTNEEIFARIKEDRIKAMEASPDNTWRRLQVREKVEKARVALRRREV